MKLGTYKKESSKMHDLNKIKKICNDTINNQDCVNGLLIKQLAVNPRGFKFSETAITKILNQKTFESKLFIAVKFALVENLIRGE
tara:strand:- start:212 stop:466 length:255 start_codon:yes stop_codon:yes gene_type:complete